MVGRVVINTSVRKSQSRHQPSAFVYCKLSLVPRPLYTVSLASFPGRPTIKKWKLGRPVNETIASYQKLMVRRTVNEASVHIELVEPSTCNANYCYTKHKTI